MMIFFGKHIMKLANIIDIKHSDLNMLSYKDAYKKCYELNVLKHKLNMNESITDMMNLQELHCPVRYQIKKITV